MIYLTVKICDWKHSGKKKSSCYLLTILCKLIVKCDLFNYFVVRFYGNLASLKTNLLDLMQQIESSCQPNLFSILARNMNLFNVEIFGNVTKFWFSRKTKSLPNLTDFFSLTHELKKNFWWTNTIGSTTRNNHFLPFFFPYYYSTPDHEYIKKYVLISENVIR